MSNTKPNPEIASRAPSTASRLVGIDPHAIGAAEELAVAIRTQPAAESLLLRAAGAAGDPAAPGTLESLLAQHGAPTVRALAIGLELCVSECRANAHTTRWTRPLAQALAARAICRQLGFGEPAEAFALGLVHEFGSRVLADWKMPAQLVQAITPNAAGESRFDASEDDALGLSRILSQAIFLAEALEVDAVRASIDWARMSTRLEAVREILELDARRFSTFFGGVGRDWAEWHALLGLPVPRVPELEQLQRRTGGILPDEDVVRALESVSTSPLKGLRILAVDDDPTSLKVLERSLRKSGHEVVTAVNGNDALRIALEMHPQAVIADWMMPEMDGLDLCKALRRSELGRSVFFLLLTGRGEEDRIVEAFDAGVDDYVTKPFNSKILMARLKGGQRVIELQERVEANRRVVMKQVAEMGLLTRKLRNAAHTDALTELPNRRYAMVRLDAEWAASRSSTERPLSVILIDIDNFKRVNDTYGHDVGDAVLKEVAMVLRANARHGEEAARMGGEEFFVVCANANESQARIAGERLRSAIERHVITSLGQGGGVTISVGVAERTPEMPNQDALIKASDQAVYAAKAAGRNRVVALSEVGNVAQSA